MSHRILISAFSISGMRTAVPMAVRATKNAMAFLDSHDRNSPVDIAKIMTGITFDGLYRLPGIYTTFALDGSRLDMMMLHLLPPGPDLLVISPINVSSLQ